MLTLTQIDGVTFVDLNRRVANGARFYTRVFVFFVFFVFFVASPHGHGDHRAPLTLLREVGRQT